MHAEIYQEPGKGCYGYTINFDKRFKELLCLDTSNLSDTGFKTPGGAFQRLLKRLNMLEDRRVKIVSQKDNATEIIFHCHACGRTLLPSAGMVGVDGEIFCYNCQPLPGDEK